MGKTLSGKLYIAAGTEPPYNSFTEGTLAYTMFSDNPIIATRSSYSNIFSDNNTGTLYKSTEKVLDNDAVDVYYYAGNISNNWVKFGKNENDEDLYWRIIRTNADGSVRLLYHGTGTDSTEAYITTSAFNKTNNKSMYVGYMYGTSDSQVNARVNTNNSDIKNTIDTWYEKTLLIKTDDSGNTYDSYLSTTAVYCNDRSVGSGTWCENCSTTFYYKTYSRLSNEPSYDCTNEYDAFSVSNTNAQLTHPVALMTADEIRYAGGKGWTNNPSVWYYLNSEGNASTNTQFWWLLSPSDWSGGGWSYVFFVYGSTNPGYLNYSGVSYAHGVRPTVSVKSNVRVLSGNGTAQSPYTLGL